jgi:TPR repeat protein
MIQKDLEYYLSLDYPFECYVGEHEVGDAFLIEFTDFEIKASGEDYEEAVELAHEYLAKHIYEQLQQNKPLPHPGEGVRFMQHKEALKAYKAKDFVKAKTIWEQEAQLKNDQAMANLGLMYLKGEGVQKDFVQARKWFEKAIAYDNDSAHFNLALMYQSKIGVQEDIQKAKAHFRQAVAKNHTQAAFRLALLLLQDRSNEPDVKEGFACMLQAAQNGHAMAQIQLAGLDKELVKSCELNHIFRTKSYEDQLEAINDVLDRFIQPMLVKDGGNILLIDYINEEEIELRLAYQGACAGCSMASTGTYEMIRNTLEQLIDARFRLYIL